MYAHLGRGHDDATKRHKMYKRKDSICAFCVLICAFCELLSEPADRTPRQIHPNALHLRVKIERVAAHLAAVARLFITTEGRRCIEHVESIDPNNARLDLFRKTMRTRDVPGPNASRETVD